LDLSVDKIKGIRLGIRQLSDNAKSKMQQYLITVGTSV